MSKEFEIDNEDVLIMIARFLVKNDYFKAAKTLMVESKLDMAKPVGLLGKGNPQEKA